MQRMGYTEEHEQFRRTARAFLDRELEPNYRRFVAQGGVDKAFWRKAGEAGLLGALIPEDLGGPGGDFTFNVILAEELGRSVGSAYTGSTIMADVATAILLAAGTPAQKAKYAPKILSGEISQAMPLSEPGAGSDATAIRTTAVRDGDHILAVIRGSDLDWTIVRFPRLTDGPRTGTYRVGYLGKDSGIQVARADGADFVLKELRAGQFIRQMPVVSY